jgi:hypothetical protein
VIAVEAPELLCFRDSLANFDEYPPLFTISNLLEPCNATASSGHLASEADGSPSNAGRCWIDMGAGACYLIAPASKTARPTVDGAVQMQRIAMTVARVRTGSARGNIAVGNIDG